MKWIKQLILCFALLAISHQPTLAASNSLTLSIGEAQPFANFTQALAAIPADSREVTLRLTSDLNDPADAMLSIPTDRGIEKITIENGSAAASVTAGAIGYLIANGIPLTLGEGVKLENGWIIGGMLAENGRSRAVENTQLVIHGSAAYIIGGGASFSGGRSVVTGVTNVVLGESARVYWEVFGGGLASGTGSYAEARGTIVSIAGNSDYALGGGCAQAGGTSKVSELSQVRVEPQGQVGIALFGGGCAQGTDSQVLSADTEAIIKGSAAWTFGGDFVFQGGSSFLSGTASISVHENGRVKALYGGSFATDEGSCAMAADTEIDVQGTAETQTEQGEQSNGGSSTVQDAT